MELTTFSTAELATGWEKAIRENQPVALAMAAVPVQDPTDRWLAHKCWQASGMPANLLKHAKTFRTLDFGHGATGTLIRFEKAGRIVEMSVNEAGKNTFRQATMSGHEDARLQRNAAQRLTERATHVQALKQWLRHGSERRLALSNQPTTEVSLNDGQITLCVKAKQIPGEATRNCGPAATREEWQREIIQATGELAATMGCPELADEITQRMTNGQSMPPGGRWIGEMHRRAARMLQNTAIDLDGYLYLPLQYEHAEYHRRRFSVITGRKISGHLISSLDYYMPQRCVMRETTRDNSGRITDQKLHVGNRVPAHAKGWLQDTGIFPGPEEHVIIGSTLFGLKPGQVNDPLLP